MERQVDKEMPLVSHLGELRSCLLHSALGIFVAAVLSFAWCDQIFVVITEPLRTAFDGLKELGIPFELIGTSPAEAFVVKLKIAIAAGFLLSSPYTFFQVWRFLSPALRGGEDCFALPFIFFASVFFLSGVSFCFFVVFPFAFEFFSQEYQSVVITPTIKIADYLSFSLKILLVFGLIFELPLFTYFLSRLGLISHRWLIEKGRYAIVFVFVAAAILTPPDPITQCLLAGPLLILYGICIGVAYLVGASPDRDKCEKPRLQ